MAKVQVQVTGGSIQQKEADTVGGLKSQLNLTNYSAQVNGEPANDDQELSDFEFVTFTQAVKGGA